MLHPSLLRWVILLLICTACHESKEQRILDEFRVQQEVQQAFEGLVAAAKSLDAEPYLKYFDQRQFLALNADGTVVHDLATFAEAYRQQIAMLDAYQSLAFKKVKINVLNAETAILVNEFKATVLLKDGTQLSVSGAGKQVWVLRERNWRLVSVSSSMAAPIPAD